MNRVLLPMAGQSTRDIDMEVAGHSENEELIRRVAKEFYVDTEVTSCPS